MSYKAQNVAGQSVQGCMCSGGKGGPDVGRSAGWWPVGSDRLLTTSHKASIMKPCIGTLHPLYPEVICGPTSTWSECDDNEASLTETVASTSKPKPGLQQRGRPCCPWFMHPSANTHVFILFYVLFSINCSLRGVFLDFCLCCWD